MDDIGGPGLLGNLSDIISIDGAGKLALGSFIVEADLEESKLSGKFVLDPVLLLCAKISLSISRTHNKNVL